MNETNKKKRVKTNFVFIFEVIFFCNSYRVCINTEFYYCFLKILILFSLLFPFFKCNETEVYPF